MFQPSENAVRHLSNALHALPEWYKLFEAYGLIRPGEFPKHEYPYEENPEVPYPVEPSWQELKEVLDECVKKNPEQLLTLCSALLRGKLELSDMALGPLPKEQFIDSLAEFEVALGKEGYPFDEYWIVDAKRTLSVAQMPDEALSKQSTALPNEIVFPKGTQYEGFKKVTAILRSAKREILIVDSYLNNEVLDMLIAAPAQPNIKLLTFKPAPDFKAALKRFQGQYQRAVETKTHSAEIHDRVIVVDGTQFYALGGSIKDIGAKLTFLNRVEDAISINTLRTELDRIWAAAVPLS